MEHQYKRGDLVRVNKPDLYIRKDGFVFGEGDCEEGKIPRDWFDSYDVLPEGSFCTFIALGTENPSYAIIQRDLIGRKMMIRVSDISIVSSIDDASE